MSDRLRVSMVARLLLCVEWILTRGLWSHGFVTCGVVFGVEAGGLRLGCSGFGVLGLGWRKEGG